MQKSKRNKDVLISVIMPVYNGSQWFDETIKSILNQSYGNLEFIIVDDCSTDSSYELLEGYVKQDKRIKLFKTPKNFGNPGGTGAFAIDKVSKESKYILPIDQDDIAVLDRVKKSVEFMEENPDIDICGGWQKFFGDKTRVSRADEKDEDIKVRLLTGCPIAHSTAIFRKSFFNKHNFNYQNQWCQDYLMWTRACLDYGAKVHNLQEILLYYRIHSSQVSGNNHSLFKADENIRAYQLKKLGFTDKKDMEFHEKWKKRRLTGTKSDLDGLENHIKKILILNKDKNVYPHETLIKRLNYLYKKELLKHGMLIKLLFSKPISDCSASYSGLV
ncbi:MAG: glycosyltransferase family 2 protein [Proteobacteria bacterium]|nr:glycosyltransferase family 2 protein [Pseudomonadota bacterium]